MAQTSSNKYLIFWTIWIAMLIGFFFYQFVVFGNGLPHGEDSGKPKMLFLALPILTITMATVIRWVIIPRIETIQKTWVTFIVGLILALSAQIFQLVLIGEDFPKTQLYLFILSLLTILQFAPIYIGNKTRE